MTPTEEAAPKAAVAPKKAAAPKGKTVERINQEVEKSTLGDNEALNALKEKMNAAEAKGEGN
jgi:small subunit ribosomal protein S1